MNSICFNFNGNSNIEKTIKFDNSKNSKRNWFLKYNQVNGLIEYDLNILKGFQLIKIVLKQIKFIIIFFKSKNKTKRIFNIFFIKWWNIII